MACPPLRDRRTSQFAMLAVTTATAGGTKNQPSNNKPIKQTNTGTSTSSSRRCLAIVRTSRSSDERPISLELAWKLTASDLACARRRAAWRRPGNSSTRPSSGSCSPTATTRSCVPIRERRLRPNKLQQRNKETIHQQTNEQTYRPERVPEQGDSC